MPTWNFDDSISHTLRGRKDISVIERKGVVDIFERTAYYKYMNRFQGYDISNLKGVTNMKIAVTYENGQVFQHFGHTEQFKIYTVEDGKVVSSEVVDTNGSGHGALAGFLDAYKVDTLICGGIGAGAKFALADMGIELFAGTSGDADAQVKAFLAGKLNYNPHTECNHHGHDHHHDHDCGSHGCGSHCGH